MVKNIGGYTRSYGASASKPEARGPERSARPALAALKVAKPALAEAQADESRRQELGKAVGAVIGRALEGKELPLDVAQTLLNKGVQSEVMSRVQDSIMKMRDSGFDIDLMAVGENLSTLDQEVIERIRR